MNTKKNLRNQAYFGALRLGVAPSYAFSNVIFSTTIAATMLLGAITLTAKNASASPAQKDPLSFLETSSSSGVRCEAVSNAFLRRYQLSNNVAAADLLPEYLREEFRHVKAETCQGKRFARCDFSWCGGTETAARLDAADTYEARKKDENSTAALRAAVAKSVLAEKDAEKIQISKAAIPAPALQAEATALEVEVPIAPPAARKQAEIALPAAPQIHPTELNTTRSNAEAARAEQSVQEIYAKKRAAQGVVSESTLIALNKERISRIEEMIKRKKAEEEKFGIEWKTIVVPGSLRPPKPRPLTFAAESNDGGQETLSKISKIPAQANMENVPTGGGKLKDEMFARTDAAGIRVNDPTVTSQQDAYFRMLNSRGTQTRTRGRLSFPQLSIEGK